MRILTIDIGAFSTKFCVADVRKNSFQVLKLLQVPVPEPYQPLDKQMEKVVEQISNTIMSNKLTSDRLIVGIPSSMCSFRFINVPFTKRKRIDQVLSYEVEDIVPFSAEELIIDYQIVRQDKGSSELFLAMVPQVHYDNYMSIFLDHNLEPDMVMPDTVAYSIFCEKFIPQGQDTAVFIDIGHSHSSMTFVKEGKMDYVRPIPFGYVALSENIIAATNYTQEQVDQLVHHYSEYTSDQQKQYQEIIDQAMTQLVVEVNQTIISYKSKTRNNIGEFYVSGGFGQFPYIAPTLEGELNLKVGSISRFAGSIKSKDPIDLLTYATSIGYAARFSMSDSLNYINFRRKETKVNKILQGIRTYLESEGTRHAVRAVALLLVILVPYLVTKSIVVNIHYEDSKKSTDKLIREIVKGNVSKTQRENFIENPEELLSFLTKSLETEKITLDVFEKKHTSAIDMMHRLMGAKPKRVVMDIDQLEFNQTHMIFRIKIIEGEADAYLKRIEAIPMFESVESQSISEGLIEVKAKLKAL